MIVFLQAMLLLQSIQWGWAFLVVLVLPIVMLSFIRQKWWHAFASRYKKSSRFVLFIPTILLMISILMAANTILLYIPTKLSFESPNLVSTAIKLGLYGLLVDHEVATQLPEDKQALNKCVEALIYAEIENYQNTCGDNISCFQNASLMNKQTLIAKIKESQTTNLGKASDACKDIDDSKL